MESLADRPCCAAFRWDQEEEEEEELGGESVLKAEPGEEEKEEHGRWSTVEAWRGEISHRHGNTVTVNPNPIACNRTVNPNPNTLFTGTNRHLLALLEESWFPAMLQVGNTGHCNVD